MPKTLLDVPLELLLKIAVELNVEDFVSLRDSRIKLGSFLNSHYASKAYVTVRLTYPLGP